MVKWKPQTFDQLLVDYPSRVISLSPLKSSRLSFKILVTIGYHILADIDNKKWARVFHFGCNVHGSKKLFLVHNPY
ncbi:hypothetical protein PM082_011393 [Marasmius tenuissimus]|nr:hypothetical protein PM082_011393 [Marasmius tenuissimus]